MVSTRSSSGSVRMDSLPSLPATPATTRKRITNTSSANGPSSSPRAWSHAPTAATLLWLAVSLPLVIWDTGYVLGRPHTMHGGAAYWPLYVPYKLYATVDYVYGLPALEAKSGFTGAQGFLNAVETAMYLVYLWLYFNKGVTIGAKGAKKAVNGKTGSITVLIGFSAAVMTLSKTVLYWANEYFSGYANVGHNNAIDLLFLWIIPNGAWLVGSAYMTYAFGSDIVEGLTAASHAKKD